MSKTLRKASEANWSVRSNEGIATENEIQSGSLQRIADALETKGQQGLKALEIQGKLLAIQERAIVCYEAMAQDRVQVARELIELRKKAVSLEKQIGDMAKEREELKRTIRIQKDGVKYLYRRIRALKGVITRMKK